MLRNVLAVVVGCVVGGIVNMGLITVGLLLIPAPAGVDMTTPAAMAVELIMTPLTTIPLTRGANATDGPTSIPADIAVARHPATNAAGTAVTLTRFIVESRVDGMAASFPTIAWTLYGR